MIIRMPDYFSEFECIAAACTDSCCIGWEIDLDDDSADYYRSVEGPFGDRMRSEMREAEDGGYCFALKEHGRCPMLNDGNLCDLYIALGEAALSEVCTDFPRFSMSYGNVLHKCLSLSCEEVCRIVFSREDSVKIIDVEGPDFGDFDPDEIDENEGKAEYEIQQQILDNLWDRSLSIDERIRRVAAVEDQEEWLSHLNSYESFCDRLACMKELEPINQNWINALEDLEKYLTEENYASSVKAFLESPDYNPNDIEQLMVYFIHRYFFSVEYIKLSIAFTYMVRDMYVMCFVKNGGHFTREDAQVMPRVFSKGVEHAEENLESLRDAILFHDI